MSTADHAGRPLRPTSAGRGPYADGGNAGAGRSGGGSDGSALRRLAGDGSGSGREETRPVPVSGAEASATTSLPKFPEGYTSRTGDDSTVARERARTERPERTATPPPNGRGDQRAAAGAAGTVTPAPSNAPSRRTSEVPAPARPAPARRVRLTVSRVDPWSAMKLSFLLSVALGIAGVVMVAVLWTVLEGMGVFDQVNGVIGQVIQDNNQKFDILDYIGFTRVVSLSIVIGVVDVILITAIATLGAFLYNVSSALVGGVQLTLTDD